MLYDNGVIIGIQNLLVRNRINLFSGDSFINLCGDRVKSSHFITITYRITGIGDGLT